MMSTISNTRQLDVVDLALDDLLAAIDGSKRALAMVGIIPCICSRPFQSRGAHNRVCGPCRNSSTLEF